MTDIIDTKHFNIKNLRQVTDKRNNFKVTVRAPRFIFPDYSHNQVYDPDYTKKIEFANIIENTAICLECEKYWLIVGEHERYVASILDLDFWELTINPDQYKDHFMIVAPTLLAMYMCWDDVLYIFDDDKMLVAKSKEAIEGFRKARNI